MLHRDNMRLQLPKIRGMHPDKLFAEEALIVFIALVALQPFTSDAFHIVAIVLSCFIAVVLPFVHIAFDLRGIRLSIVLSFVQWWLGAVVLLVPIVVTRYRGETTLGPGSQDSDGSFLDVAVLKATLVHSIGVFVLQLPVVYNFFVAVFHLSFVLVYYKTASWFALCVGASWPVLAFVRWLFEVVTDGLARRRLRILAAMPRRIATTDAAVEIKSNNVELQDSSGGVELQQSDALTNISRALFASPSVVFPVRRSRSRELEDTVSLWDSSTAALTAALPNSPIEIRSAALDEFGVFLHFSWGLAVVTGVSPGQVLGRSFISVMEWLRMNSLDEVWGKIRDLLNAPPNNVPFRFLLRADGRSADAVAMSPLPSEQRSSERFAIVLDAWRVPRRTDSDPAIIIAQPMSHSVCEALPAPICLLHPNSSIIVWNDAIAHLTECSAFEMIGRNAFSELFGSSSEPMIRPRSFPFVGEARLSSSKGQKAFSFTLMEWPNSEGMMLGDSSLEDAPLLCFMDRGKMRDRAGTGGPLMHSLHRLIREFNAAEGTQTRQQRMSSFCNEVISLVMELASIEAQEQRIEEDLAEFGVLDANGIRNEGSGEPNTLPDDALVPTPSSPTFSPPGGLSFGDQATGAWARLISQDTAIASSCLIATAVGKEFRAGRSAHCMLKIRDTYVSGIQFSIVRKPGGKEPQIILRDQSANGTFVNVKRVGKGRLCVLHSGDLINFRLSSGRFFLGFVLQVMKLQRASSAATAAATREAPSQDRLGVPRTPRRQLQWRIGEEMLGKGGNAKVYLGLNLTDGKLIAVKRVPMPKDAKTQRQYEALQEEIGLLSVAVHQNVVQYHGSQVSDGHLNILLEFVPGGSIRHLLDNFGPLSDTVILRYLQQMLRGLRYLHQRQIVHSDLKCANVLVTDKGEVKITDFGTAKLLKSEKRVQQAGETLKLAGTLLWMAPEVVRGETECTFASDMWSVGCCLVEMIGGEHPWAEYEFESEEQIMNLLKFATEPPEIPPCRNSTLHAIASACLKLRSSERPTADGVLSMLGENRQQQTAAASGAVAQPPRLGRNASVASELMSEAARARELLCVE